MDSSPDYRIAQPMSGMTEPEDRWMEGPGGSWEKLGEADRPCASEGGNQDARPQTRPDPHAEFTVDTGKGWAVRNRT